MKANGYTIKPAADLGEAELSGADLKLAYPWLADLSSADVTQSNLTGVTMPDGSILG